MEFLDINLTKESSLLLHACSQSRQKADLKITILFSGFKNHYKNIRETRKIESIHEYVNFVEWKNEGRKIGQKLEYEKT
jgi:hypothetical protein